MARRPKYWHMLQASKSELLLAVDLWNRRGTEVNTSACVVHAQIAWLYLAHAHFERQNTDYWYRRAGRRVRGTDGEFRAWELQRCVREIFLDPDEPIRRNLEFFIGVRNKIEHRWESALAVLLGGKIQALVLNYEKCLSDWFGESLADELRFPMFLSSITTEARDALLQSWDSIPKALSGYIQNFDDSLPETVASDLRYEFKVALIPYTGSKSDSPVAMTFIREEDLDDDQREALRRFVTIIREKQVPVQHMAELKPSDVCARVQAELGCRFGTTPHHSRAWHYFEVRPASGDPHPERTDPRYCQYSAAFKSYVYTTAWVRKLSLELQDAETFLQVTGQQQVPLRA